MKISDPLTFLRGVVRADSLCCETVGAWLQAHGYEHLHTRDMMLRAWKRGIMRHAALAAGFMGLVEIGGGRARDGDVVIVMQENGEPILGLAWRGRAVCASGGRVAILASPFLKCWRVERPRVAPDFGARAGAPAPSLDRSAR